MALSQKLAQFNKQQEKLQASLAKINQSRPAPAPQPKASVSRKAPARESTQNAVPFAQRFSFTNDTEKLQQIATIRRAPVGAQIKRVLDLLLETPFLDETVFYLKNMHGPDGLKTRQSLLPEEINDLCFVDVAANKDLFESLKSNVKVSFDGKRFAYKSKHDVKNKQELLVLIRKVPEGIPMGDLKDSYPGVITDVQELKASGDVWLLMNSDSQEDIAYPNDPKIKIKVDEDLKQLIRSIEIPREFIDVERELTKAGLKPATNTARREAQKGALRTQQTSSKKTKKRRETKRTKYTNAHLPELFQMNIG